MTASAAESAFQKDIIRELTEGGWVEGSAGGYDRARALYPEDALAFVKASQPCAGRGADRVIPGVRNHFQRHRALGVLSKMETTRTIQQYVQDRTGGNHLPFRAQPVDLLEFA